MHLQRDIGFEDQASAQHINKGEYISFCKDFKFFLPKTRILAVYKRVSPSFSWLSLDQCKQSLPYLGEEFGKAKAKEVKHRLAEIKAVLEYPNSRNDR